MASQIGRGMRIMSTKQDVGMGEEMLDAGPKPSRRLLQSCIAKVCARNSIKMVYIQVRITAVCARA